jgi:hypothetical protein
VKIGRKRKAGGAGRRKIKARKGQVSKVEEDGVKPQPPKLGRKVVYAHFMASVLEVR